MEATLYPTPASTQAIRIPVHSNITASASQPVSQNQRRRSAQRHRCLKPKRVDSEEDNISGSSLGSDWTSSPTAPSQPKHISQASVQASVTSPEGIIHEDLASSASLSRHAGKGKQRASPTSLPPNTMSLLAPTTQSPLGPSMLSSSAYKSINLNTHGDPESNEPARLITYTKHSQGFTWNDELFLPSYLLGRHRHRPHGGSAARRRWADGEDDEMGEFEEEGERCPVTDIFVTDEEAAAMMP